MPCTNYTISVGTDEVQQTLVSAATYEKEQQLLREQFGALIFDDRTAQGSLFRSVNGFH